MKTTIRTPYTINESRHNNYNTDAIQPTAQDISRSSKLFMVCSGHGGIEKGAIAANLVCNTFFEYVTNIHPISKQRAGQIYMNDALRHAERKMQNYIRDNSEATGMSSTIAMLHINEDDSITIAWVGNSRIYHIRGNKMLYRTEDHLTNIRQHGESKVIPRAISGNEPVWASVATITDIYPGDYFFLCTPGVTQVLDDRNIKYLLSQGDGTEATNQAIIDKIKDLCNENDVRNYSAILLQIESSILADAPMPIVPPAKGGTDGKKELLVDVSSNKKKFNFELPSTPSMPKIPVKALGAIAFILLLFLGAFFVKRTLSSPAYAFNKHVKQSETFIENKSYDKAIAELEKAIAIPIEDKNEVNKAKLKLRQTKELVLVQEADELTETGNLIKAKATFEEALALNAENGNTKTKYEQVTQSLCKEKGWLRTKADSLMQKREYEKAKRLLYDALYLDQLDNHTLKLIHTCNLLLDQDSVSLETVIKEMDAQHLPKDK